MMKYADLFSGCGGLSLGVERAGGELVLAVEKSEMAARTFYHNFFADVSDPREWDLYKALPLELQAKHGVAVSELRNILDNTDIMESLIDEKLDLVVGGPPCQGFSLAGRRNPEDIRNKLPWEYLSFVERANPKAVVIENVVGMSHRFSTDEDSAFKQLQLALQETGLGYEVQGVAVNASHYGAPQNRPRLLIIGLRRDLADSASIRSTGALWKSSFLDECESELPPLAPKPTVKRSEAPTIADAIADLQSVLPPAITERAREFRESIRTKASWGLPASGDNTGTPKNQNPRKHSARTQDRFRLYQWMRDNSVSGSLLGDIARGTTSRETLLSHLQSKKFPAVSPDQTPIAQDVEELIHEMDRLATLKHSQKALSWECQAPTVVTLPDDYVHPSEPRIFTVRELARFQGFPDDFVFTGKETTGSTRRRYEVPQYSQVGNAVSPFLAHAVGTMLARILT